MKGIALGIAAIAACTAALASPPAATLFLDKDGVPVIRYSLAGPTSEGRFVNAHPETHAIARKPFWSYDKACYAIDERRVRRLAESCGAAEFRLAWDEQVRDRFYPGVVRLGSGGVLVATQYLQPLTNDGRLIDWTVEAPPGGVVAFRGEKTQGSITLGGRFFFEDGRGYAYLGPDDFVETPAGRVLIDRGVPKAVSDEVIRVVPRLLEVYGLRLGRAPAERPSIYLTWGARAGSQRHTQADVVPGAVARFGLTGSWWGTGDPHTVPQLRKLVAHELAHFWNAEVYKPVSWAASWVTEGNAELLALAALLAVGEMTPGDAARQVSSAFNDCMLLARNRSWSELYHYEKHSGRGPYTCGLALQFGALAAAAKADPGLDAFGMWKRIWAEHPRYYEAVLQADLVKGDHLPGAEALGALLTDKSVPLAAALRRLLALAGIETAATGLVSGSTQALHGPFMAALMAADCQNNLSFGNFEDRFEIVDGSEILCKTFLKGQVFRVVEGERFFERTASAIAKANAACKQGGLVRLRADDGSEVALPCPAMPFADEKSLVQLAPEVVKRVLVQ